MQEDVIGPAITGSLNGKSDEQLDSEDYRKEKFLLSDTSDSRVTMTKSELEQSPESELQAWNGASKIEKSDQTSTESPTCATSDGATDLFVSNSDLSSSASSPVPPEPFQALFKVTISPNDVTKDGDLVKYTMLSERVCKLLISFINR